MSRDPLAAVSGTTGAVNYTRANPLLLADASGFITSTGGQADGGTCTPACVSFWTLAMAKLAEANQAHAAAQSVVNDLLYGDSASIMEGPEGVMIVSNASGVVGNAVRGLGFSGDNTITFGTGLIVSSADIGVDPASNDVLRHEYGALVSFPWVN